MSFSLGQLAYTQHSATAPQIGIKLHPAQQRANLRSQPRELLVHFLSRWDATLHTRLGRDYNNMDRSNLVDLIAKHCLHILVGSWVLEAPPGSVWLGNVEQAPCLKQVQDLLRQIANVRYVSQIAQPAAQVRAVMPIETDNAAQESCVEVRLPQRGSTPSTATRDCANLRAESSCAVADMTSMCMSSIGQGPPLYQSASIYSASQAAFINGRAKRMREGEAPPPSTSGSATSPGVFAQGQFKGYTLAVMAPPAKRQRVSPVTNNVPLDSQSPASVPAPVSSIAFLPLKSLPVTAPFAVNTNLGPLDLGKAMAAMPTQSYAETTLGGLGNGYSGCLLCGRLLKLRADRNDIAHAHRKASTTSTVAKDRKPCPGMLACGASYTGQWDGQYRYRRVERMAAWILYRYPELRYSTGVTGRLFDHIQTRGFLQEDLERWWKDQTTLHGLDDVALKAALHTRALAWT